MRQRRANSLTSARVSYPARWQPCSEQPVAVRAKGSRGGGVGTLKILRSKRNDGKKTFAGGTKRRRWRSSRGYVTAN